MNCWEEQAEVSDGSCKSSQLSMAHSSFQGRASAGFCTCLTIKIKSCGLWVEAVLKYLYILSWLCHHPCCLPRWIKAKRKGLFLLSWFGCQVYQGQGGLAHPPSQEPPSPAKCSCPCSWGALQEAVPQFWSQAGIQMLWDVSDFCKNTDSHLMSAFLLTYKLLCSMFLAVSLDPSKHQTARTGHLLPLLMTWILLVGYYAPFDILEILNNYVLRYSIPTL